MFSLFLVATGLGILSFISANNFWDTLERVAFSGLVIFSVLGVVSYGVVESQCNFELQTVSVVTESGVVEEVENEYYKGEDGNYYILPEDEEIKEAFIPFYVPKYEKVDAPVFVSGNLVVMENHTETEPLDASVYCINCGSDLSEFDSPRFCYACGEQVSVPAT